MNKIKTNNIKQQIQELSLKIDKIVLDGGIVGLGDPLNREMHRLRTQLTTLEKPKLPRARVSYQAL